MKKNHLQKRMKLLEKGVDYKPTEKELKEAYQYLDFCLGCEKEFKFGEPVSHGIEGNYHKFGCSYSSRIVGWAYSSFYNPCSFCLFLRINKKNKI